MSTTTHSSSKIPIFSGKRKDWDTWSEKFLARAKNKGYKSLLIAASDPGIPLSTATTMTMAEEDIAEKNDVGYGKLILAMDTEKSGGKVAFNIVKATKTTQYADGNIWEAWRRLKKKYETQTAPTLAKLHKMFYKVKLKKNVDPDVFITYLEDLRIRMESMGSAVTDKQFMLHVLSNLNKD